MDALKFVWAYMLKEGIITKGVFEYYSMGYEHTDDVSWNYDKQLAQKDKLLSDVKSIGIDWDKTKEPVSSMNRIFNGTFDQDSNVESLLGTLYLKNGKEYLIGVSNCDTRFSSYVKNLMSLAEDKALVKDILGE
jgi:hypothetical protein